MDQATLIGLGTVLWVLDAIAITVAIVLVGLGYLVYVIREKHKEE
jgi:hypothetical protein